MFVSSFICQENTEIVHYERSVDFLFQQVRFPGVEVEHSSGMLQVAESYFNAPYADILEMPINFWQNPVPGVTPDTGNNYRHLFQSAQALYNILIVSIFESDIILKDRTITIA